MKMTMQQQVHHHQPPSGHHHHHHRQEEQHHQQSHRHHHHQHQAHQQRHEQQSHQHHHHHNHEQLPIVIAGGGPCGLLTALVLLQSNDVNVPVVIYERVSQSKLSISNIGSGFDLSPTALDILRNKLKLPIDTILHKYNGICVGDMKTKLKFDDTTDKAIISDMKVTKLEQGTTDDHIELASVFRAELQKMMLDALSRYDIDPDQNPILQCGITVTSYEYNENPWKEDENSYVTVHLSNGRIIQASALLGCDGIHSSVRRHMIRSISLKEKLLNPQLDLPDIDDALHYCGMECWWGKTIVQPESDLQAALQETKNKNHNTSHSGSIKDNHVWLVGNGKFFMGKPATRRVGGNGATSTNGIGGPNYANIGSVPENFMWAYFIKKPLNEIHSTRVTGDSTKRGGSQPTLEEKKIELEKNTETKTTKDEKKNKNKDKGNSKLTPPAHPTMLVNPWRHQYQDMSGTSTNARLSPTTIIDDYDQETIDRITSTTNGYKNASDIDEDDNLLHMIMKESKVDDITRVAIYDRQNLNIPYSDRGRVALLGDAAHPLPPFLFGQGVNMALVDGYVCASLIIKKLRKAHYGYNDYNDIGKEAIIKALKVYDCKERHENVNKVIKQARIYGNTCVKEGGHGNPLTGWIHKKQLNSHLASGPWLTECIMKGDKANHEFVESLLNKKKKSETEAADYLEGLDLGF